MPLDGTQKSRGVNRSQKKSQPSKTAFKSFKGGQSGKFKFKKPIETNEKTHQKDSIEFEYGFEGNESSFETDGREPEKDSNTVELTLNRTFDHSPTIKTQNLTPNQTVGDSRVQQLKAELAFITDGKKRITDSSQLALVNYRIDSLISQLGMVGYDVEFTDDSETDFIITKF